MKLIHVVLLCLTLCLCLPAQEVTGSILGTIVDSSGAAIPGATIKLIATDRDMLVRTVSSDQDGNFSGPLLPIGIYSLKVELNGFKSLTKSGIELHVNDKLSFKLEMQVGEVTEQITVESSAVTVELQSPAAGGLITGTEVQELSLNNRNYIQLISLMPGAVSNSATDEVYIGTTNPLGSTNTIPFSLNGGRTSGNNFTVDGADNVDRGSNLTLMNYPSVDAIAEFKAVRGLYSAESGRAATGQITVMTKSGGAKYHGSVYEFFRNDKLSANTFFNNARNISLPPLRYNNFGYTIGGPVPILNSSKRENNKTFFFWSQEFRRVITYSTFQSLVPTNDMKKGVFSQPVCLEYTGSTCTSTGNSIAKINPVAAAYVKDIWSQIPEGDNNFTLFTSQRSNYNHRQELIKIDHTFTPRLALSVRYLKDTIPTVEPGGLFTGAVLPGVSKTRTDSPGKGWVFRTTATVTPSLLNEAGYAFSYGAIVSRPEGAIGSAQSPDIKVPLPFASTLARVPSVTMSGVSSVTGYGPYDDFNRNHNAYDNLTKIMRKHTLKVGVSLNFYQKTENNAGNNAGTFAFPATPRPTGTAIIQQSWANFLLGNVSTFTQTSLDLTPDMRARQFEAYIQDDYRVRPNLTVNIGVRYSMFRQPYDANGMLTNFDPAKWDPAKAPQINPTNGNIVPNTGDPLNGIVVNNQNSPYGSKVSNEDLLKFAPRIGLAWDPFRKGRTAIRTGYGISYDSTLVGIYEQNIFSNPPFLNNVTISNTRFEDPVVGVPVISAAPKTLRGTPSPAMIPYTQQWSFDVQQQFGRALVVSAGYYGSKSTHLLGIVDMNSVRPGAAVAAGIVNANTPVTSATTPLLNAIRPYRGYGPINTVQNWFNSNYNSLQTSAQRQFSSNSSLRMSYTWSKVLTDATSDRSNAPQNFYNRSADYARATFDRKHVLTFSYIYAVPLARQSKGALAVLAKGWQLSGISTFNAGLPIRVTSGLGLDWAGLGILGTSAVSPRPDMISNPQENAPHTIAKWFDTAAFAAVPTGEVRPGNASATSVVSPGYQRWDVSMMKNITLREGMRLQFRAESFNFVNHTNFLGVGTSLGATNFGQITSTREPRRVQLALKLAF